MKLKFPDMASDKGMFIVIIVIIAAFLLFGKKKGTTLGLAAEVSDDSSGDTESSGLTGGGDCPAGQSGLDDLAAGPDGNVTVEAITNFCQEHPSDCGCTSL